MFEKLFYELRPYLYGAFGMYALLKFTHSQLIFFFSCTLIYLAFIVIKKRLQTRGLTGVAQNNDDE